MERSNQKPIELTAKELDTATGGTAPQIPPIKQLPRNPFPWPTPPKA